MKVLYFAYGSNLDSDQMKKRCPSARSCGPAVLKDHVLRFCGYSKKRKGGVADVYPSKGGEVEGILYQLDLKDVNSLDRYEGYPISYERASLRVDSGMGEVSALVYFKERSEVVSDPHPDYVEIIAEAYERFGFDTSKLLDALK